jgi:pyruvate/oxaloacetate carboxyltransferase
LVLRTLNSRADEPNRSHTQVIKGIKVAAAEEDVTASVLLEQMAKEFLERRKSTRSSKV